MQLQYRSSFHFSYKNDKPKTFIAALLGADIFVAGKFLTG